MKPRWLLLAVSVLCLLLLFPASVLSQRFSVDAGCGTATIDGYVGANEWANAATLPLYGFGLDDSPNPEGVGPSQLQVGDAYFMNDGRYLYLGAILSDPESEVPDNPTLFEVDMQFAFEDEPAGDPSAWVDCTWAAASCDEQDLEDEGALGGETDSGLSAAQLEDEVWFTHFAKSHLYCDDDAPLAGVTYRGLPQGTGAHMEMKVDLETSPLNNPSPAAGDCFDLRWLSVTFAAEEPTGAVRRLGGGWPEESVEFEPYEDCTILCLNPCEVEFVPEPGSILLLVSGLTGLAGYAGLRKRSRA
jgi:hypothetical protein